MASSTNPEDQPEDESGLPSSMAVPVGRSQDEQRCTGLDVGAGDKSVEDSGDERNHKPPMSGPTEIEAGHEPTD